MPANKKAAKKKIAPKAKPKKVVKQAKKAVVKKAAVKKAPIKVKPKTEVKKSTSKKSSVKSVPSTKAVSKVLKTKKVVPTKASKPKKGTAIKKVQAQIKPTKKTIPAKKQVLAQKKAAKKVPAKIHKPGAKPISKPLAKPTVEKKPAPKKVDVKKQPFASVKSVKEISPDAPEKSKKQEEATTKKQLIEQKSKEVLAITNSIPVEAKHEISLSKIASISHSITNPIKRTESYSIKTEKEPNGKFELEFVVHASAEMIYEFISTPSGLSEWFCDDLNIRNGIYTFIWDDTMQQARLLKTVELQLVRFQWVDKVDGSYFELRIQRDDLTNDISLMITDFAETVAERESSKLLWNNQVEKLLHVLGSVF